MADYGWKITKPGKGVTSTDPNDYVFWSKYQQLTLLYKAQQSITVTSAACTGTATYTHSLGFKPLVLAYVNSVLAGTRVALPFSLTTTALKDCGAASWSEETFTYRVKVNTVEIDYTLNCIIPMFGTTCPTNNHAYTVDLYFYMFELGS